MVRASPSIDRNHASECVFSVKTLVSKEKQSVAIDVGRAEGVPGADRSAETQICGPKEKRALTVFLDAAEDVVDVVWEESLCVQHCLDEAGDGAEGHVLCMCMAVPLRGRERER